MILPPIHEQNSVSEVPLNLQLLFGELTQPVAVPAPTPRRS